MTLRNSLLAAAALVACGAALQDIPQFGLGTWLSDRDEVTHAVEVALKNGYNHIDAAAIYRNEDQTGRGIAASGIAREDLWVTSKLWNTDHRQAEAEVAIRKSIADLGVEYLDLYLIHWPVAFLPGPGNTELDHETTLQDTWRTLEGFVRANLTRYIGLSNFAKADVEAILEIATIRPYAHEFETHPYLQQQDFVDYHVDQGIEVIAYSPLANTNPIYNKDLPVIFEDPFWKEVAAKKNATVAQAVLAWGLQRGTSVIPKSTSVKHLAENLAAASIHYTEAELDAIQLQDKKVRLSNPSKRWGVKLFADLDDPTLLEEDDEVKDL
ncbi:aldo/keto reductase [Thozetella sp. PMI_491]|nr:aldo/keto reductase [Thozetella sp. PMI_491]